MELSMPELSGEIYRDFENRRKGEPDDGPLAWKAHREREQLLREALDDAGFSAELSPEMTDAVRPHELATFVAKLLVDHSAHAVLAGAGAYLSGHLLGQVDKLFGNAVGRLFGRLTDQFKKKRIGDFWIKLPDGSKFAVDPNGNVALTFKDGKVVDFNLDNVPK
jgi:hypothetical protein